MRGLNRAYGEWLNRYPWDYFLTIAPRYERVSPDACFRLFGNFLKKHCGPRSYAFCAVEKAGQNHIHALIGGTRIMPQSVAATLSRHGILQIVTYKTDGGAAFYSVKQLGTELCSYDVFGRWPKLN